MLLAKEGGGRGMRIKPQKIPRGTSPPPRPQGLRIISATRSIWHWDW